ncbi:hypothetical protein [Actinoplanes sp. NPDC051851]|uniref:hypothetical protein n=1 Tax=Actinoplanes sp. NPDC051851 TaxID=3154753 RepID=UPI0034269809
MTPLDDHSQQRRPLFFPVVIATVLLTIIGMIGGHLLGERRDRAAATSPTSSVVYPSASLSGPLCPEQTQEVAARNGATGELYQVLRVTTDRKTVVWICRDAAGRLYYHANKGGTDAEWVEGKTALFLDGVQDLGGDSYRVVSWDNVVFEVDRARLLISRPDGEQQEQEVVGD